MSTFLISGATGYIGSSLSRALIEEGHQVHGLSQKKQPLSKIIWHYTDGSYRSVQKAMEAAKPDVILHLAAHYRAKHSSEEIRKLLQSNVEFGTHLLEAAVTHGCSKFINTGSYWQNANGAHYSPTNLYAASKEAFKDIAYFYSETFSVSLVHLKLFDVYGPDDPRPKFISLLRKARSENDALNMTPGNQIIRLVHLYDVVKAYKTAIQILLESEELIREEYFISGEPLTLREIVRIYQRITGTELMINWGAKPYNQNQIMSPYTGKPLPGWAPEITLYQGLQLLED